MRRKNRFAIALIAASLSTLVVAGDSAWETPTTDNFAVYQLEDPARALAIAREMRKQFDAGHADAGAIFSIALDALIYFHMDKLDAGQKSEVARLKAGFSVSEWLLKAAQAGSQAAIMGVCRYANREATPHDAHAFTLPQCRELRAKYPKPVQ